MESTSASLLQQLRQRRAPDGWVRFVKLYTPLLFYWARRLGLEHSDAADLVQDVFATLVQKLPNFEYNRDKGFRNWLRTVLVNRWRDGCRRRALVPAEFGADGLSQVAAPHDPDAAGEAEYREYVVRRALHLMQTDFAANTWKACWEHGVLGRPAAEVAADLGISVGAVYAATSRVMCRLRQELEGLLE